jgi:hypothetical protein
MDRISFIIYGPQVLEELTEQPTLARTRHNEPSGFITPGLNAKSQKNGILSYAEAKTSKLAKSWNVRGGPVA